MYANVIAMTIKTCGVCYERVIMWPGSMSLVMSRLPPPPSSDNNSDSDEDDDKRKMKDQLSS